MKLARKLIYINLGSVGVGSVVVGAIAATTIKYDITMKIYQTDYSSVVVDPVNETERNMHPGQKGVFDILGNDKELRTNQFKDFNASIDIIKNKGNAIYGTNLGAYSNNFVYTFIPSDISNSESFFNIEYNSLLSNDLIITLMAKVNNDTRVKEDYVLKSIPHSGVDAIYDNYIPVEYLDITKNEQGKYILNGLSKNYNEYDDYNSIVVPNYVSEIAPNSFSRNKLPATIKTLFVEKNSELRLIGQEAFFRTNLETINLSSNYAVTLRSGCFGSMLNINEFNLYTSVNLLDEDIHTPFDNSQRESQGGGEGNNFTVNVYDDCRLIGLETFYMANVTTINIESTSLILDKGSLKTPLLSNINIGQNLKTLEIEGICFSQASNANNIALTVNNPNFTRDQIITLFVDKGGLNPNKIV